MLSRLVHVDASLRRRSSLRVVLDGDVALKDHRFQQTLRSVQLFLHHDVERRQLPGVRRRGCEERRDGGEHEGTTRK